MGQGGLDQCLVVNQWMTPTFYKAAGVGERPGVGSEFVFHFVLCKVISMYATHSRRPFVNLSLLLSGRGDRLNLLQSLYGNGT